MLRFFCYIDESGQDTQGQFFIVAIVIVEDAETRDTLERQLEKLERQVGKKTDWRHTRVRTKIAYLEGAMRLKLLKNSIFYAVFRHRDLQDYDQLTAVALIKAIRTKTSAPATITVAIEGQLGTTRRRRLAKALRKAMRIRYRRIRGQRFKSSALIRLADACAGFLSDLERAKPYTKTLQARLQKQSFFQDIS